MKSRKETNPGADYYILTEIQDVVFVSTPTNCGRFLIYSTNKEVETPIAAGHLYGVWTLGDRAHFIPDRELETELNIISQIL